MNTEILIPGVLIIQGNRTYGKKGNNFLYKFVSHDYKKKLLIPFQIKGMGFNKCFKNKYVIVKQLNETDGIIFNNLGDTDILENFYEYSLHCKNLSHSIKKFTKHVGHITMNDPYFDIFEDRTSFNIISIDPSGCADIDDAFGIQINDDNKKILSVYISNVPFTIDTMGLWNFLSPPNSNSSVVEQCRVSSIYLPNKKIPMLPPFLSDNLCSLLEGNIRGALAMDVTLTDDCKIEKIDFKLCFIKVTKNYNYDDIDNKLVIDEQYNQVHSIVDKLNIDRNYLAVSLDAKKENIDSHDVIAFLMILMNHEVGKLFKHHKCGIFRKTQTTDSVNDKILDNVENINVLKNLPKSVSRFLSNKINGSGNYSMYEENIEHRTLRLDSYVHITSPIRRLVDLLNMVHLQTILGLYKFSYNDFFKDWYTKSNIDHINVASKKIRKVQNECNMLDLFSNDETIANSEHCGYLVDKYQGKNNNQKYSIHFHISEKDILINYSTKDILSIGDKLMFKIIVFKDESDVRQKIRLHRL